MVSRAGKVIHESNTRLSAVWGSVAQSWRDEVAAQFGLEFWRPLEETIRRYADAVEELEDELRRAEEMGHWK
jgi:hypothetical protein